MFSYDGRLVCTPRYPGMKVDVLNQQTIAIRCDTVAIRDKTDEKVVYAFDAQAGKIMGDGKPITHKVEVMDNRLDQCGITAERKITLVDKNRDLLLTSVPIFGTEIKIVKLANMIQSHAWNDETNMLAAMTDGKILVWYCPNGVYIDKNLLPKTLFEKDTSRVNICMIEFGKDPQPIDFLDSHLILRMSEDSLVYTSISPYPLVLYRNVMSGRWADAVCLCRFVKEENVWACLAAMATYAKDLNTAEIAYAAIQEADKVQLIINIKEIP